MSLSPGALRCARYMFRGVMANLPHSGYLTSTPTIERWRLPRVAHNEAWRRRDAVWDMRR